MGDEANCPYFEAYMKEQKEDLVEEINKYKYLESEKEGRDIGWRAAQSGFLLKHFFGWREAFRIKYCENTCERKGDCRVYDTFYKIAERNFNENSRRNSVESRV